MDHPSFSHRSMPPQEYGSIRDGGISLAAAGNSINVEVKSDVSIEISHGHGHHSIHEPEPSCQAQPVDDTMSMVTNPCDQNPSGYQAGSKVKHAQTDQKQDANLRHHNDPPRFFGYPSDFKDDCEGKAICWEPIEHIADLEMKICYVSSLEDDPIVNDFMTPEIVEEMHFDGPISPCNVEILLRPLTNLKLLDIHISTLENLSLEQGDKWNLENLESLEISSTNFTAYHASCSDMCSIFDNTIYLLQNYRFPKLIYLSVSIPTYPPMEAKLTHAILHFISVHHKTLKYLNIDSQFKITPCDASYPLTRSGNLATPAPVPAEDMDFEASQVQLTSFHYYSATRSSKVGLWRKFARIQKQLEYCQLWCDEYYFPIPYALIKQNQSTLHTLVLNVDVMSGNHQITKPILGSIFQHCTKLTVLFLKGNSVHPCGERDQCLENPCKPPHRQRCHDPLKPDLIEVSSFTKSLERLKLVDILLLSQDVTFIVKSLPNLIHLHLKGIGETEHMGMKLSDLNYILNAKTLKSVEIMSGLNRASFNQVSNETKFHLMTKILFKSQKCTTFRSRFNKDKNEYDAWDSCDDSDTDNEGVESDYEHDHFFKRDSASHGKGDKDEGSESGSESESSSEDDEPGKKVEVLHNKSIQSNTNSAGSRGTAGKPRKESSSSEEE